jgi:hypothetical protein
MNEKHLAREQLKKKKEGPKFKQMTTPKSAELTMGFCIWRQATVAQNAIL